MQCFCVRSNGDGCPQPWLHAHNGCTHCKEYISNFSIFYGPPHRPVKVTSSFILEKGHHAGKTFSDVFITNPKYRDKLIKHHYASLGKKHDSLKKFIKWSDLLGAEIDKRLEAKLNEEIKQEEENNKKRKLSEEISYEVIRVQKFRAASLTSCTRCDVDYCVNEDGVCAVCGLQVSHGGTSSTLFGEEFF